ncbi:head decoration protein [Rhizobium straminoryzae]|uniref:Head decoration protein n=1 Tax=Rhizobium straminoryzae TaxID=1387186 RepID=A0A549T0V5_9HYPH|nr:head decoration protein [Rhizobium straminoryzae]TRL35501.1 head decoration protein [Rhizobium straminoryzae]
MTVLTQKLGPGSCIISEAADYYSRDVVVVSAGAGITLPPNTVLGRIAASGKYVPWNPAANDGSQTVAAILIYPVTGEQEATVLRRVAQVKTPALNWFSGATLANKAAGIAGLATLGIIAR